MPAGRQLKGEQYWGRIAGTDADHETEQWILNRFQKLGLADTKIQELDLPPQWLPRSWRVMASADSGTAELATVQPVLGSPGTTSELSCEVVYAGIRSRAQFARRDLKGKAVVIRTIPVGSVVRHSAASNGAIMRAAQSGAATIFLIVDLPGNIRSQLESAGGSPPTVPTFSMGASDGARLLEMMDQSTVTLRVNLAVEQRVWNGYRQCLGCLTRSDG